MRPFLRRVGVLLLAVVVFGAAAWPFIPYLARWGEFEIGNPEAERDYFYLGVDHQVLNGHGEALTGWVPYVGGGYSLLAHPRDPLLSFFAALPAAILGEVNGARVLTALFYALGVLGMFGCASASSGIRRSRTAVWLSTLSYAVCPWFFSAMFAAPRHALVGYTCSAIVAAFWRAGRGRAWFLTLLMLLLTPTTWGMTSAPGVFALLALVAAAAARNDRSAGLRLAASLLLVIPFALPKLASTAALFNECNELGADPVGYFLDGFAAPWSWVFEAYFLASVGLGAGVARLGRSPTGRPWQRSALAAGVGAVLLATTLGAIPATRALPTHLDDRRLALYEAGIQRRWLGAPMHKANETEFFQVETCNSAAIGESDPSFNEVRAPWLYGNDRPKPPAYWFWRAGIGTIDWDDQGWTVRAAARPRFWRMPGDCGGDDQTPRLLPNAAYRGEAYTAPGWQAELCTTRISVDWLRTMVEADGWVVVVFNQNAVGRWRTSLGTYERTPDDLVAVRLTLHGIHRLSLVYLAAELKFFWVTFIALLFLLTPASDPLFVAVGRRQRE